MGRREVNAFTSGTQAAQNRTVNHDPMPWVVPALPSERYAHQERPWEVLAPRPEFAVLDNPILAGWRNRTLPSNDLYEVLQDLDFDSRWRAQFTYAQIAHARRVLTKLANVYKEN